MQGSPPPPGSTNPYAAPETPADMATVDGGAPAHDLTREEVRAFVGLRNAYYWRNWQRATGGSLRAGFNWAAFFLSFGWMLNRKMYRETLVGFAILLAVGVLQGLAAYTTGMNLNALGRVEDIAVAVTMGMLGNGLYLRRARRIIADVRAREPDPERREALLRARGGRSWLGILIAVVLTIAGAVVASMAG
jgi:hypothetical protein